MEIGTILSNQQLQGDYREVEFYAPEIAGSAVAGQFVHVRIDERRDCLLRRPFSIHDVTPEGGVRVVYKVVGTGTRHLAGLNPGAVCNLLGPQGRGFTAPAPDAVPVLVAGGYGAAATYLLARTARTGGVLLLGARSAGDVILTGRYRAAGFDVRVATNDGSLGQRGLVTDLLAGVEADYAGRKLFFYGCGPHPMLLALARYLQGRGLAGELSIDHLMCCGVGACFACVVKIKDGSAGGWTYARACHDGPVFPAEQVYLED